MALDHGTQGTAALQALYRTLTRPSFSQKPCPFCNNHSTEPSHFEHFIHLSYTLCQFWVYVELLIRESTDVFVHAKHFLHPVSSWPSPLLLAIASPCTCCIDHAIPCWLLMHQPLNLWTFENGVLCNWQQPSSAVNSCFDHSKFEAMKSLSGCEPVCCDEHQFCTKIKGEY